MSYLTQLRLADGAQLDAFARLRVSEPHTLFDSKQIFDNAPLFWDEELESGASISSAWSQDRASTIITSTLNTAGVFTRQTFRRFNYQPGKSQSILMTGILDASGGGTGVQRRIGYFDDDNGLFFEDDEGTVKVVRRSNVTGSPVNTKVAQSSWNLDVMDGTGVSGITVDWTKTQIFTLDFEWLGTGRVRMGLVIGGVVRYVHEFLAANVLDAVYMSTPNLPLRYQMVTTASSPASTLECICATVISEGGIDPTGQLRSFDVTDAINANSSGTWYVLCGLRLKTAASGCNVQLANVHVQGASADDFMWGVWLNPTLANAITFSDETNSCLQSGPGNAGNPSNSTISSGGTLMNAGLVSGGASDESSIANAILLGADISGNRDEIYLCAKPFTSNADIRGTITWREDS